MINIYNKFTLYGGTMNFSFLFIFSIHGQIFIIIILNKNVHVQKQRDSLIKHVLSVIFLCLHGNCKLFFLIYIFILHCEWLLLYSKYA